MGTSLTGLTPATTYDALIKVGDNGPIDATLKTLSDGLGNDLPMQASTAGVNFTGTLSQSGTAVPTAAEVAAKQDTLVSATNIKTINSTSLLGAGDISISASPSGVAGAIQFSNGSAFASDASNLFWDDTNKRLGIGTNAPVKKLNIVGGDVQIGNSLTSGNFNPATYRTFTIGSDFGSGALQIGNGTTGLMWGGLYANINNVAVYANSRDLTFETPVEAMRITSGRNVGIGETTPTARLQVKGSGSTSATTSLLVQNSAGTERFKVTDNGVSTFTPASAYTVAITTGNNGVIRSAGGYENADGVYGADGGLFLRAAGAMYITANNGNISSFGLFGNSAGTGFNIGVGLSVDASSVLNLNSTNRGFLPPRMTTTQKNAIATPASGLVVYDTTTNKLCCYNGSTWNDLF